MRENRTLLVLLLLTAFAVTTATATASPHGTEASVITVHKSPEA